MNAIAKQCEEEMSIPDDLIGFYSDDDLEPLTAEQHADLERCIHPTTVDTVDILFEDGLKIKVQPDQLFNTQPSFAPVETVRADRLHCNDTVAEYEEHGSIVEITKPWPRPRNKQ